MGVYSETLEIPTDSTELNPATKNLLVLGDYITKVMIVFPAGNRWTSKVAVYYGIKQLYPFKEGQWFFGENETITFETLDPLPGQVTVLKLVGWNNGGIYPHTVGFRIVTAWQWQVEQQTVTKSLIEKFDLLLRRIGIY